MLHDAVRISMFVQAMVETCSIIVRPHSNVGKTLFPTTKSKIPDRLKGLRINNSDVIKQELRVPTIKRFLTSRCNGYDSSQKLRITWDKGRIGRSNMAMWSGCRFLDTEVDGSNPGISMLFP